MNFSMKIRIPILAAATFCCLSCIEANHSIGGNFIPAVETYSFYTAEVPLEGISVKMADQLSGYSDARITIGSILEPEYGLTTRASAVTLVPLISSEDEDFTIGANPVFQRFHFAAATDTTSYITDSQENILQQVRVYELSQQLDPTKDYDCNQVVAHNPEIIAKGTPVINGVDSLSFDFSESFGRRFLSLTRADLADINTYLSKFPGIYLETPEPEQDGNGRINMLQVQLSYDANYTAITGNYATLYYSAEFGGVRKDTSLTFYYGATKVFDLDSLFSSYSGTFPQYALNLTGHQTRDRAGVAGEKISIEGGGGLKPVISALSLKHQVEAAIRAVGGDPHDAVINKASLVFPFDFPEDYLEMRFWPYRLSPTCRLVYGEGDDTSTTFMWFRDPLHQRR